MANEDKIPPERLDREYIEAGNVTKLELVIEFPPAAAMEEGIWYYDAQVVS